MLIAAKYEEIYPPYIKDFIYITDSAYSKEQILEMEIQILQKLQFYLTCPTSLRFLERYCKLAVSTFDQKLFFLAKYMLELCLIEVQMNRWSPSLLACSALYIAKKILHLEQPWSPFMTEQTTHVEKEVHKCARDICMILNIAHTKRHFKAVFKKYSE